MKKYLVQGAVYEKSPYSGRMTQGINKVEIEAKGQFEAARKYIEYWNNQPTKFDNIEVLRIYELVFEK